MSVPGAETRYSGRLSPVTSPSVATWAPKSVSAPACETWGNGAGTERVCPVTPLMKTTLPVTPGPPGASGTPTIRSSLPSPVKSPALTMCSPKRSPAVAGPEPAADCR